MRYTVHYEVTGYFNVPVDADDKEQALAKAAIYLDQVGLVGAANPYFDRKTDWFYTKDPTIMPDDQPIIIDGPPTRLCCGQKHYGVQCPDGKVMCCLCFERFTRDELQASEGTLTDVCKPCAAKEEKIMANAIHRTVFQIEVFSRGPYDGGPDLATIEYDISEGSCIGDVTQVETSAVPPRKVEEHMLRIGNDGSFFEDDDDFDPDAKFSEGVDFNFVERND